MSDTEKNVAVPPASGRSRNSHASIQARLVAESQKIEKSKAKIKDLKAKDALRIQKLCDSLGFYQYTFTDDELRGVFGELIAKKLAP